MQRTPLTLTPAVREELESVAAKDESPAGYASRARIVLLGAEQLPGAEIARRSSVTREHVSRVLTRFRKQGVSGLRDRPKTGRRDHAVTRLQEQRVLELVRSPPPLGRARWTTRLLGAVVGLSSLSISRILRAHEIKPHAK